MLLEAVCSDWLREMLERAIEASPPNAAACGAMRLKKRSDIKPVAVIIRFAFAPPIVTACRGGSSPSRQKGTLRSVY